MAIDNGKLILSHDQSLREQLDDIATCIGDFRVSTLGRDVGMLCHSPNVNQASLRRPFHVGRFVKGDEVEMVMQEKDYGYAGLRPNSKLSTGAGTTMSFIRNIVSHTTGTNFWQPSALDNTDIAGTMQFDGYNHNAKYLGEDDTLQGLETIQEIPKNTLFSIVNLRYGDGYDVTVATDMTVPLTALSSSIKISFYFPNVQYGSTVRFNISGYIFPKHSNSPFGTEGQSQYFRIDTNGHETGETWTDSSGNTIEYRYDSSVGHCVDLYLTQVYVPRFTDLGPAIFTYQMQYVENFSTSNGTQMDIKAKVVSNGIYNIGPSSNTHSKIGFYYEQSDSWYQEEWNTAKQGRRTPYQHIFTDNGVNDSTAILIVIAKSFVTADEMAIVNPRFHEDLDDALNGYIMYDNLGFSDNCLNHLQAVYVIKCFGDANFITSQHQGVSTADDYKLIVAPVAYKLLYGDEGA